MTDILPAVLALLEGKSAEIQQHHYDARVGNYQGSRVQNVRDVLEQWAPSPGTPLHALWTQVDTAIREYTAEIEAIQREAYRDIPGINTGEPRD